MSLLKSWKNGKSNEQMYSHRIQIEKEEPYKAPTYSGMQHRPPPKVTFHNQYEYEEYIATQGIDVYDVLVYKSLPSIMEASYCSFILVRDICVDYTDLAYNSLGLPEYLKMATIYPATQQNWSPLERWEHPNNFRKLTLIELDWFVNNASVQNHIQRYYPEIRYNAPTR
jgi:hypothetical protein